MNKDDDASAWKAAADQSLLGMAGAWMKRLEGFLPPESGAIVIMYNKQGDPAHVITVAINDDAGVSLKILNEAATVVGSVATKDRAFGDERSFSAAPSPCDSDLPMPPMASLISSATVARVGGHERVRLWNRGALAGELVLHNGDGDMLCALLGLTNPNQARSYEHDLAAMIEAAKRWRAAHVTPLRLRWPGSAVSLVLGALTESRIEVIGVDAYARDFLRALNDSVEGRATVLMAQAAFEATAV